VLEETDLPRLTFTYMTDYVIKIIYIIMASAIAASILFGEINISLFGFGVVIIFHFVSQYFKLKLFKVPLQKIDRLVLKEEHLTIRFKNRKNNMIEHTVRLDDPKETQDIQQYLHTHFQPKLNIA
jgi:GTP cyclohydrolase II